MAQFYIPDLSENDYIIELNEEESKHSVRVLRLNTDDTLTLLNGKGLSAHGKIVDAHPKKCKIQIESFNFHTKTKEIHIAVCPTKSIDRMEWLVEKAVELGLTKLTFLLSKNSERTQIKMERLEKIAVAAMKQSKRFYLPEIQWSKDVSSFVSEYQNGFIAHCYPGDKVSSESDILNNPILIGPEGDFTVDEVEIALKNGYRGLDLGEFRLRTETAALTAVFCLRK